MDIEHLLKYLGTGKNNNVVKSPIEVEIIYLVMSNDDENDPG